MAASYRRALLDKYGIAVQEQWVANVLQAATNNAASATVIEALLYRSFLMADLNQCGTATLPPRVSEKHNETLAGCFVLQVDELVDISQPNETRFNDSKNRMLKLSLTDGEQRAFGMELRRINQLSALSPPGIKVAIKEPMVKHGMLQLTTENTVVLGGGVVSLMREMEQQLFDRARKRQSHLKTKIDEAEQPSASQPSASQQQQQSSQTAVDAQYLVLSSNGLVGTSTTAVGTGPPAPTASSSSSSIGWSSTATPNVPPGVTPYTLHAPQLYQPAPPLLTTTTTSTAPSATIGASSGSLDLDHELDELDDLLAFEMPTVQSTNSTRPARPPATSTTSTTSTTSSTTSTRTSAQPYTPAIASSSSSSSSSGSASSASSSATQPSSSCKLSPTYPSSPTIDSSAAISLPLRNASDAASLALAGPQFVASGTPTNTRPRFTLDTNGSQSRRPAAVWPYSYLRTLIQKPCPAGLYTVKAAVMYVSNLTYDGFYSVEAEIDDGTACTVVLLDDTVLSRLFELPCHDFVMLDDAAQAQVLTRGTQKLAALEGVMRIEVNPADRLPTVRRIGTLAKADLWNMARVLESSL